MNSARTHLLLRPESVSRALGFYIPATAAARALGLVRGVILARLISEHEFGLLQVALLVVNVLNPLCGLGLNEGVARYVPMYETRGLLRTYLRRVVPFVAAVALTASATVFLAAEPLGRAIFATLERTGIAPVAPAAWTALTRIAAGATFGTVLYFLTLAMLKGMRMFRAVSLLELGNNALFTVLAITAAVAGWKTAGTVMGCYGLAIVVVVPLFAIAIWRTVGDAPPNLPVVTGAVSDENRGPPLKPPGASPAEPVPATDESEVVEEQVLTSRRAEYVTSSTARPPAAAEPFRLAKVGELHDPGQHPQAQLDSPLLQLLSFSAWAAVAALIWQVLQYYPMWYLQKMHGPSVTAIFGGVRLVTQVVMVGAVTVIAVIQTSVTKLWESRGSTEADRRLALAYKSTSLLMLAGSVSFALAARPIMALFPASYSAGVRIVPLCLMFFLISAHLTFIAIHFALIEKMRHLFWPWTLGFTANIVLAGLLVRPGQPSTDALVGAAWAGVFGLTAALAAAILLMARERRPIDAGTLVFWMAIYVLALPAAVELAVLGLLLAAAVATGFIFTAEEKHELREYFRHACHKAIACFRQSSGDTGEGSS